MSASDLDRLLKNIRACKLCADKPTGAPLPHEPRPVIQAARSARLCICGQAPGTRVHQTGIPFNDPSGDRLRDWMGIDREAFYDADRLAIVPMGFCFPGQDARGGDLPPRRECRAAWHDGVFDALPNLELILVIGQYAKAYHLPDLKKASLTETVRTGSDILNSSRRPRVLPLPHPSWRNNTWLKRNPWFESDILPILRSEVAALMQSV